MMKTRTPTRLRSMFEDASPSLALVERVVLSGIEVERLTPMHCEQRVVLHVPGGFQDDHRTLAARLAATCRARVVSPDRGPTSGSPFLTGLDDLVAVYRALLRRGTPADQIVVVGDASGGGLALEMLIQAYAIGLPMPRALVLLSPCMANFTASELAGLPPMLIQVGDRELASAARTAAELGAAGVEFELEAYAALRPFGQSCETTPDVIEALDRIAAYVDDRFATSIARLRHVG